ncbi:MAG TPA: HAMP domain-containing sensor histidine kinase [Pseudolabrys sp.]|nr:HAMP domain-containing sensor histidine kinase [Pseudolabrys sp.]
MLRNSFHARLILGAAVWISVGLAVSGFMLSAIFRDLVTTQIDHDLSDHAEELGALIAIGSDGRPVVSRKMSDPRFAVAGSGLYWQIERSNGMTARSASLNGSSLPLSAAAAVPRITVVNTAMGPLRLNQRLIETPQLSEPLRVGIAVEVRIVDQEVSGLNKALILSLLVIAIGLTGAAVIQVNYGLKPLSRLRHELVAVRAGKTERLPDDLPVEVAPLIRDLNSMIATNNEMIRRARAQAGNLAHALKTPLAVLMDEGQQLDTAGQTGAAQVIKRQCTQMQRQIDYQMARARAAGRGTPGATTLIGPAIREVIAALSRLHKNRAIRIEFSGQDDLSVACDPQDFSEIIGNLTDNAAKWCRSRVSISGARNDGSIFIKVEDDGPGIPAELSDKVFDLGEKLDEAMPGSGLGLAITRELVTLYGGSIWLEPSRFGGTAACLRLPAFAGDT